MFLCCMKRKKTYQSSKEKFPDNVQEQVAVYGRIFRTPMNEVPFFSKAEALSNGISLENSRLTIMEKIKQDFAK